jgi:hypothetical protein
MRRYALALVLVLLAWSAPLAAQTYSLAPPPYQTVLNNSGAPVNNACVWTYAAGTTTPIATYSDNAGTTNPNPIRTDSAGRYTAYLVPGTGYKFVTELPCTPPAHGVVLRTSDNVAGTPTASVVTTGTWIPSLGGTTTYTAREGTYVRVGALVLARGSMTVNLIGTGSANSIAGLPFPVAGDTPAVIGAWGTAAAPLVSINPFVASGGTSIGVGGLTAAGVGITFLNFFGNGTIAQFSVTYQTLAP